MQLKDYLEPIVIALDHHYGVNKCMEMKLEMARLLLDSTYYVVPNGEELDAARHQSSL